MAAEGMLSIEGLRSTGTTTSPNRTPPIGSPRKGGGGGGGRGLQGSRRRSLTKQVSLQKASCLCSPTTHVGSFRCRLHRNPNMTSSVSVGSGLSELADKVEFTFNLPSSHKNINPCMSAS